MQSVYSYINKFLQVLLTCYIIGSHLSTPGHSQNIILNLPDDFPEINLNVFNNPSDGYIFAGPYGGNFFPNATPYLTILDNWCTPVFYRKMDAPVYDFKLQENGYLSYYKWPRQYILDSSYRTIDTIIIKNHGPYDTDFHELKVFEDGSAFLLGFDDRLVDMDTVVPGGHQGVTVRGCLIQEQDPEGNVVFEWSSWDHFLITDASTDVDLTDPNFIDYVHTNAIEVDSDTTLLISNRNFEEITKIDRRTGEIIWRMGGKNNQFTFINDTLNGFRRQHDIRKISNGNYTLFDNGGLEAPLISRAVEYDLDEINFTATLVNSYRSQPDDIYGAIMGNAQWLNDGHILVGWGSGVPNITEFHPDGNKAWEVEFESISYRAYRFPWKTNLFIPETDSIHFGEIHFLDTAVYELPVLNTSEESIQITGYHHHDPSFSILNDLPVTIEEGKQKNFYLQFDPDSIGVFNDIITIQSDINTPELVQRIARQVLVKGLASPYAGTEAEAVNLVAGHYPNPHAGTIHLVFHKRSKYEITITGLSGEIINQDFTDDFLYTNHNLISCPAGIYIIRIRDKQTGAINYLKSIRQ